MKKSKVIIIALILLAVGIGFLFLPVKIWVLSLQVWIKGLGILGPVVFVLLYIIATVFLIPGSALTLAAGAIFGLWLGAAIVITGANLGALLAFILARTRLRDKVSAWAAASPKFAALDRAIAENDFKMVTLTRLSPAFPFTLLNYFLGLTAVRPGAYIAGNLLGMLPATFLYVYLGSLAGDTLTIGANSNTSGWQLALKIVGLVATIAVVVFVTRIARQAMKTAAREIADENAATPDLQASEVR